MLQNALASILLITAFMQLAPIDGSHLEAEVRGEELQTLSFGERAVKANTLVERVKKPEIIFPIKRADASNGVVTTADTSVVIDEVTGLLLFGEDPYEVRSMGSVTKIMTAMVFLDSEPDLDAIVSLGSEDVVYGGRFYVRIGKELRLREVLEASMIGSDNSATKALMRLSQLSEEAFLQAMHEKARELGMNDTYFTDPTGIDRTNVSTAHDIAKMLREAAKYEDITRFSRMPNGTILHSDGEEVLVQNTDILTVPGALPSGVDLVVGKTGYLPEAGYVFGAVFEKGDRRVVSVVMGSESSESRAEESLALADWAFDNYIWQTN